MTFDFSDAKKCVTQEAECAAVGKKPKKKKSKVLTGGQTVFLVTMLTIPILHWFVFWLYVNINTILLGFQTKIGDWSLSNFTWLFQEMMSPQSTIVIAIKNTFIYFFNSLIIIMPLALIISYFLYRKIFFGRGFRIIFYLPSIISSVALTTVFANFIAPTGPIGAIMEALNMERIEFLQNSQYATFSIVVYCIWTGFGTNMLLFSGAMSRIPLEIVESAKIDGCGMFKEIIHITMPLIWPTLSTMLILQATGLFSASGPILLFTKGQYQTTTIGYWIFDMVYNYNSNQLVSAAGLFFTCIGVPIILLVRWLIEKVDQVEY